MVQHPPQPGEHLSHATVVHGSHCRPALCQGARVFGEGPPHLEARVRAAAVVIGGVCHVRGRPKGLGPISGMHTNAN
eukprot:14644013-Alexandrium_andersonii.AAC.1